MCDCEMDPTGIDRTLKELSGRILTGTARQEDPRDFEYLSARRTSGLVQLPSIRWVSRGSLLVHRY